MNLRRWFHEHSLKLLAIRDTPEAIAGGITIGIFFGFTPLFGLKTVLAIFLAWLTRSNILAAVLAGALHDLILPLMPFIWIWEYKVGYWFIHHEWPERMARGSLRPHGLRNWTTFITGVGKPWLYGSVICGAPISMICYFLAKPIVIRHHKKRACQS
jgi:uncharacterized protein (DUF2062 family)